MPRKAAISLTIVGIAVLAALLYGLSVGFPGRQWQLRELDANFRKWQSRNVTHYQMKVSIGCFCPFYDRMPLTVEVQDGEVLSVTDSQSQPVPKDDPIRYSDNEQLMTIDDMFGYVRKTIQTADKTEVGYDPTLGYPVRVNIDQIKLAMDDELSVVVSELNVLP